MSEYKYLTFDEFAALYCKTQQSSKSELRRRLTVQAGQYKPNGWVLLECRVLDSSRLGERVILPYGPENTLTEIPDHPVSPHGLESDQSVVIGVLTIEEFSRFN